MLVNTVNNSKKDQRDCVCIVLPSEWARLDVLTSPIYKNLFESEDDDEFSIENAPLVCENNRHHYISVSTASWPNYNETILSTHFNEPINFSCHKVTKYGTVNFSLD